MSRRWLPLLLIVALAGCGGDDEFDSAAEAEAYVENIDGPCKFKDVRCESQNEAWICRYTGGFLTVPRDGHGEIAVIC